MYKSTLVIGASTNLERYSNKAIVALQQYHHPVFAIGAKQGEVNETTIITEFYPFENIDTVTLYIKPSLQKQYTSYILSIKPKRLIFNPGTENEILWQLATNADIKCMNACTLVLLHTNQY